MQIVNVASGGQYMKVLWPNCLPDSFLPAFLGAHSTELMSALQPEMLDIPCRAIAIIPTSLRRCKDAIPSIMWPTTFAVCERCKAGRRKHLQAAAICIAPMSGPSNGPKKI